MNDITLPKLPHWPRLRFCRSPLFHGTNFTNAESIVAEDRLRIAYPGIPAVSLTRNLRQAVWFAENSMVCGEDKSAAVFILDGDLLRLHYRVTPFRDEVWDSPGQREISTRMCRDECEEAVWMPIHPVSAISVGIFRYERHAWTYEPWHSRSKYRRLHLFERLAA